MLYNLISKSTRMKRSGLKVLLMNFKRADVWFGYLGDRSLVFLHQFIHVLLVFLCARLHVVLLSLEAAHLLLQLIRHKRDGREQKSNVLVGYDKWSLVNLEVLLAGR